MKKLYLIAITLLFLLSGFSAYAQLTDLPNLPGEDEFSDYKNELVDTVKKIETYGAADAFDEIQQNLIKFRQLKIKMKQSDNVDAVIGDVADGLRSIAASYSKIADMRIDLLGFFDSSGAKIARIDGQIIRTVDELEELVRKYQRESEDLISRLRYETDPLEKRKMEMTVGANKSVVNSIKAHQAIWSKFQNTMDPLKKKLNITKERIDLLMHGLKQNARVYQAAASAAELRKTASAALRNFASLAKIDDVLGDLQNNWFEVNELVNQISEADFDVDKIMEEIDQ